MTNNQPKLGQGHAMAMARLGVRELGAALFTQSNVAQYGYGLYGPHSSSGVEPITREAEGSQFSQGSQLAQRIEGTQRHRDEQVQEQQGIEREV